MSTSKKTRSFPQEDIIIRYHFKPGDIGSIVHLHGRLYAEEWGWDHTFEPYVAVPLSEFALNPHPRQRIWIVDKDGKLSGMMAIVEASIYEAQLRWLLLKPEIRGIGLGKKLVSDAVSFSKSCGYKKIFLWTVDILTPAVTLYKSFGFELTEKKATKAWGADLIEQKFERIIR